MKQLKHILLKRRRAMKKAFAFILISFILAISGCGNPVFPPTPDSYNILIADPGNSRIVGMMDMSGTG
jgi:uncharacterized membrane protein